MNKKYRAGVYARISISESNIGGDSTSIINQKSIIEEYCRNKDIEIVDYYIDDGYSGGNFDRPSFNRMLDDLNKKIINLVITKDISRLGRDFIGTGNYIYKYFPEHNIRYIAILDNYDSLNPSISDDIIPFKAVLNDMYLKDISRKIKTSRHELMRKGYFMGSTVPYGYKRSDIDSRMLEVDEYSSFIVKRIFSLKDKGNSSSFIARKLTEEGVEPPSIYNKRNISISKFSDIWKAETIDYILSNEVYIGKMTQRKYDRVSLKSKRKIKLAKESWIMCENTHEPIVEVSLFERVNNINKRSLIRHKKYNFLLKGLVKCHDCNSIMLVRAIKSGNIYCCKNYAKFGSKACKMHYFREDVLNTLVINSLTNFCNNLDKFDIIKKILTTTDVFKYFDLNISKLDLSIKEYSHIIIELYKDKEKKILTEEEFISLKNEISENLKNECQKKAELLKRKQKILSNNQYIIDQALNFNDKNIINKIINSVTIDNAKNVYIYCNFKELK